MIVIWDQNKAQANLKKHAISFEEAQTVLESDRQLILEDKVQNFGSQSDKKGKEVI